MFCKHLFVGKEQIHHLNYVVVYDIPSLDNKRLVKRRELVEERFQ